MTVSPGSSSAATWSTIRPVIAAGTITQTARGPFSFATRSSMEVAPTAPSASSSATASGLTSKTTHSCPSRIRRRTMFAPMRPSPIIPSCIRVSLGEGPLDRLAELREPAGDVGTEVDAEGAAAALGEHGEVASGLGGLDDAEREVPSGDGEVGRVVGGDLQEDAAVRAALVGLAGRVQEARAEADAGRGPRSVAERRPDRGQLGLVLGRHLDVREQRRVVAGPDAAEVRAEDLRQRRAGDLDRVRRVGVDLQALALPDRRLRRQGPVALVRAGQLARDDLRGLDVRLVERVDADDRAGDGCGELPAEDLAA